MVRSHIFEKKRTKIICFFQIVRGVSCAIEMTTTNRITLGATNYYQISRIKRDQQEVLLLLLL